MDVRKWIIKRGWGCGVKGKGSYKKAGSRRVRARLKALWRKDGE